MTHAPFVAALFLASAAAQLSYTCGNGKIYEYDYEAVVNASTRDVSGTVSSNGEPPPRRSLAARPHRIHARALTLPRD